MSEQKISLGRLVMALGAFTFLAGAFLGGVYALTKQPIEESAQRAVIEAVAAVNPDFKGEASAPVGVDVDGATVELYPLIDCGKFCGAAVESLSLSGFSGEIRVMFGFDADGAVTGYRVLSHDETPGLGAKMEEWFRMDEGHRSVIGVNPYNIKMCVSKDGGDIDGITGATISSRAFLEALRTAHTAFDKYKTAQQ